MKLTGKQQHLFTYLQEKIEENGRSPSLREAADDLGVSRNAVAQLIGQLERKRVIQREGRYSRSIRILPEQPPEAGQQNRVRELPVIGQITAGLPMYAQQEWNGSVLVDSALFPGSNLFIRIIIGFVSYLFFLFFADKKVRNTFSLHISRLVR